MQTSSLRIDSQTTVDNLASASGKFRHFVSKAQMMTFWYQVREAVLLEPSSVLEIGVGPGVVTGVLRERGIDVETADVNPGLRPDHVVSVQNLTSQLHDDSFDVVLCARVLHHVPLEDFERCLEELWRVTSKTVILTLPAEDLRIYASLRLTSLRSVGFSVRLPIALKRALYRVFPRRFDPEYRKLWKINSEPATALKMIEAMLLRRFAIEKSYRVPEDMSHHVFVLSKRSAVSDAGRAKLSYEGVIIPFPVEGAHAT